MKEGAATEYKFGELQSVDHKNKYEVYKQLSLSTITG